MARQLPSLNQLRAFEAAARLGSIKDGARELCVTPTAVSHQIKALEEVLGRSLFHRQVRKITLTEDGRLLSAKLGDALDLMEEAVEPFRSHGKNRTLRITVAPFFGNRWLLPRLDVFHAAHDGITVEPSLSFDYVDLGTSGFDAAVRYGDGEWEGLTAHLVFRDTLRVVCAPQLVEGRSLPLTPAEVLGLPLADARRWPEDWAAWADAAGEDIAVALNLTRHESRAFMFDAALSGQAAILADHRMTAIDENAGRLVCLSPIRVKRPQGIYVVTARTRPDPALAAFVDWLREVAEDLPQTVAD